MNFIDTIKQYLAGKKTYLLAVAALIGTAVAWGEGTITNIEAIVALYAALQTIFIRAGIAKNTSASEVVKVVDASRALDESDDAYNVEARAHTCLMHAQTEEIDLRNEETERRLCEDIEIEKEAAKLDAADAANPDQD